MKRSIPILLLLVLTLTSCGASAESAAQGEKTNRTEETMVEQHPIYIEIGEHILTAELEANASAKALKELLERGPLTISASNYGGFEKVCTLETNLPTQDRQMTTRAGDICLYNGNQIVLFYGANSWAYTKLGKFSDTDKTGLEDILSGKETEITLSLESPY